MHGRALTSRLTWGGFRGGCCTRSSRRRQLQSSWSRLLLVCLRRPELVSCMLVVVERPSLNEPVIAHLEDNRLQAVQPAPLPVALRDGYPDGMLVCRSVPMSPREEAS